MRRYVVTVRGELSHERAEVCGEGHTSIAGERLEGELIEILKRSKRETHLIVELAEGKNREIRGLLKAAGHETTRLKRIAFGGIELGESGTGQVAQRLSRRAPRGLSESAPPTNRLKSLPTRTYATHATHATYATHAGL